MKTTQEDYNTLQASYYKTPEFYAAVLKEQSCEIHPALWDIPQLRLLSKQERRVWLLLTGKNGLKKLSLLSALPEEEVKSILDFLCDQGIAGQRIMRWQDRLLHFVVWPHTTAFQRLVYRTADNFWQYLQNGCSLYLPEKRVAKKYRVKNAQAALQSMRGI